MNRLKNYISLLLLNAPCESEGEINELEDNNIPKFNDDPNQLH